MLPDSNRIVNVARSWRYGISLVVLGVIGGNTVCAQTPIAPTPPAVTPAEPVLPIAPSPTANSVSGLTAPVPETAPITPASLTTTATATTATAPGQGADSYIDSTDYSLGATQRSTGLDKPQPLMPPASGQPASGQLADAPAVLEPASAPPESVDMSSLSIVGQTTPTARDFYNRTLRPPGRLGNGNISLIFPLSIPAPITSAFGWRVHPISGDRRFHSGTDLGAPMGTPVLAAYAGRVAIADFLGGYGLAVAIDHNNGTQQTLYGHLSEVFVKPGDVVRQGAVIGRVGSTGNSTGPHLHFEFRQQSAQGWVTLDAGSQLEYGLSQLAKALQTGFPLGTVSDGNSVISGKTSLNAALNLEGRLQISRSTPIDQWLHK